MSARVRPALVLKASARAFHVWLLLGSVIGLMRGVLAGGRPREDAFETVEDPPGGSVHERLLAEASLLSSYLESTTDIVFLKDRESRFVAVSRSHYTRLGFASADPMLGKTEFELYPREWAEKTFALEQEIVRTGQPRVDLEHQGLTTDGSVRWRTSSKAPLLDPDGNVIGIFCVSRDSTDHKLALSALREQTERLEQVIETQRAIAAADLDLPAVMQLICDRTKELTGSEGSSILMLEGDKFVYRAAAGFGNDKLGRELPLEGTFCGWVYRNDRPALVRDSKTDPRSEGLAWKHGIRSSVAVPLRDADGMIGQLQVLSQQPDAFTGETLRTLELVSVVLSAALSHAAEYEAKRVQVDVLNRFRTIFESAPIGIMRTDASGQAVEVNPTFERMLGYTAEEIAGLTFQQHTHPDDVEMCVVAFDELMEGTRDSYQLEKRFIRKDGETIWAQVTATLVRDAEGNPAYAVAMIDDISRRKSAEDELKRQSELNEHQALHDSLTGLGNRTLFRDRIQQAIFGARRSGERFALLMMDLDRFKEINDSLGHHAGDGLLKELGERLQKVLRASDTVARLGGDEFGLLLPSQSSPARAVDVVDKIREVVEEPFVLQGLPLSIEASIGIAFFPDDGEDVETLLRHADVAMYVAKQASSTYAFYEASEDTYDPARLTLVGELNRAIEQHELVLHYQPRALLASGRVNSVEALLRWQHPERGLVLPDNFLPPAQGTGLVKPLTLYVVEEALRQCRTWQQAGILLRIAVNISTRNLLDVGFPETVERLLEKWDVKAEMLELEFTESAMLSDPPRVKIVLEKLSALGLRLTIDDFGSGYSSLANLKRLPISQITIDRSFVMSMAAEDIDADAIVRSTIELGKNLGLQVVAEGVESHDVWQLLVALGCTTAQGYYLSRPIAANELEDWLLAFASRDEPEFGFVASASK